ncbi:exported hypothetical protein [Gammaproteobacteria bacterium]
MRYLLLSMAVWLSVLPAASAEEAKISITLPAGMTSFLPGPGMELANSQCTVCHSPDYIYMQPPFSEEKWIATVKKMKKVFGSQIADEDIPALTKYLVSQNGPRK